MSDLRCQRCDSSRIITWGAKVSDRFWAACGDVEHDGYVTYGLGIGGGDYVNVQHCLNCGQMQEDESTGVKFPLPTCKLEVGEDDEDT